MPYRKSDEVTHPSNQSFAPSLLFFPPQRGTRTNAKTTVFFIVYKGAKGLGLDDTTLPVAFAYAFGLGGFCGLAMIPTVLPYMRKNIAAKFNEDGTLKPVRF